MNSINIITPIRSPLPMRSSGALLSVVVTLALAYGLDLWIEASRRTAADTFQFMPVAWTMTAANLLLAGALLVVARELYRPLAYMQIVRSVCLFVGLVSSLVPVVFFSDLAFLIPSELAAVTSPTTHVGMASAFLVVISSFTMLRFRRSSP